MNDQVRWPTRCKRCFRDYKEHADDHDKARFGNLKDNDSGKANGPLTAITFTLQGTTQQNGETDHACNSWGILLQGFTVCLYYVIHKPKQNSFID